MVLVSILISWLALLAASPADQRTGAGSPIAAPPALPPLVQTCPMHPDVVESRPGSCPICKMNLVPTRLEAAWMCPVHAAVVETAGGACRLCGRSLVPVTVTLIWTCRGDVNTEHMEPGLCRDGSPRLVKRTLRPHGNHNPQHGGQFFMAADNWHHLEGVYTRARRFRLHVYDDYARPLDGAALRQMAGRVVLEEQAASAAGRGREVRSVPLRVAKDGPYLEAQLPSASFPTRFAAKVTFKPGEAEHRFDFTFTTPSVDQAPARTASTTRSVPRATASETTSSAAGATGGSTGDATVAAPQTSTPAPVTMPEIVEAIRGARREIAALVAAGDFAAIWVPAFRAKDLALTLEPHLGHLPIAVRASAELEVFRLVQAAWRLDAVGDSGNREEVEAAFRRFDETLDAMAGALGP